MGIALDPCVVTLPEVEPPYPSLLEFLVRRFPRIPESVWERRIVEGKVLDERGDPLTRESPYLPYRRVFYFREIDSEREIPFSEEILFQNDHLLVACKPHFLPVTPGGAYLHESLLYRLRKRTGMQELAPMHRIDRETAGIVLFSVDPGTRGRYSRLFALGKVHKSYQALARYPEERGISQWKVENRLVAGEPWFRMKEVAGAPNARSVISVAQAKGALARFDLYPETGKTHQLRLHMSGLGFPILNDRLYPKLQPRAEDDFSRPLQLLAKSVRFQDPVSGKMMEFHSSRELQG